MRPAPEHPNALRRRSILLASAAGLFLFYFLCALSAALLCVIDVSPLYDASAALLSLALSCLLAGFLCGKRLRRRGIQNGLLCGLLTCVMIRLSAAVILTTPDLLPAPIQPLLALTAGAIGGILGVNTKNRYLSR